MRCRAAVRASARVYGLTTSQYWPVVFLYPFLRRMTMKVVNILGTDYEIHFVDEFPEDLKEVGEGADGLC